MPGKFVHLHLHTEYSLLDGAIRISPLMQRLKELGMDACAITDHGSMYGIIEFYENAIKNGIKPIIGCEVYIAVNGMYNKRPKIDANPSHLILLAKDKTGFKNLMDIVSKAHVDGFYYKPRVDYDYLEKHSSGLICTSACLNGDIPILILENRYDEAKALALRLENIFGKDSFYLELQMHGIEGQSLVNSKLIQISKETGIPLVVANDAHYMKKEEAKAHDVLLCIQTGKKVTDEDRMRFNADEFYLKSFQEMSELFPGLDEAIANTRKIADMCNVEIEFDKIHLPDFQMNGDKYEILRQKVYDGAALRYPDHDKKEIFERIEFELGTISDMGYTDYFLIVWDFIRYARENGIMVGPGRGSAAGSIVSYCLGITSVDPLKYSLLFERFLNSERISLPDIDIDFCYRNRQKVIDYVVEKYGKDRVSQIITFGTMAARAVIRDVGRALDVAYAQVDSVAKMIPMQIGITIENALKINQDLKALYDQDGSVRNIIDTAMLFEGMPRHSSTHAAGVVISKEPLTNYVPLQRNDDIITTQFDMLTIEKLGLLKMDFLGLRTLTVISDTIGNICDDIDIDKIDHEEKPVYELITSGKTEGLFQLESAGMTQFMKELQPESLEDIIAGISLYRPGPMDQIPRYIKNKKNVVEISYLHKSLSTILDVTYGCIVYQEQVMQIFRELAGYSLARADIVRRAMSKKKHDVMLSEELHFIKGSSKNGIPEETAKLIFKEMEAFASYAFNKSHAAAYAVVAYQTAWLKFHYPIEFMAATLNSFEGSTDKTVFYINACSAMGIKVLNPHVNAGGYEFTKEKDSIRYGLGAIKNLGFNAVAAIMNERDKNGIFISFEDFITRTAGLDINKRCYECLIKAGALDGTGYNRRTMLLNFENLLGSIQSVNRNNIAGQMSIFDGAAAEAEKLYELNKVKEYEERELLAFEKEVLGLYISGHPLDQHMSTIRNIVHQDMSFIKDEVNIQAGVVKDGTNVIVIGSVSSITTKTTRNNQIMAFVTVEDLTGTIETIVFSNVLNKFKELIKIENIVVITGKVSLKEEEEPKIIVDDIVPISAKKQKSIKVFVNEKTGKKVMALCDYFAGNFLITINTNGSETEKRIEYSIFVTEELMDIAGKENVMMS